LSTGVEHGQKTSHDKAGDKYSLIFFIICSRALSHHYAGSLRILAIDLNYEISL